MGLITCETAIGLMASHVEVIVWLMTCTHIGLINLLYTQCARHVLDA